MNHTVTVSSFLNCFLDSFHRGGVLTLFLSLSLFESLISKLGNVIFSFKCATRSDPNMSLSLMSNKLVFLFHDVLKLLYDHIIYVDIF